MVETDTKRRGLFTFGATKTATKIQGCLSVCSTVPFSMAECRPDMEQEGNLPSTCGIYK